MSWYDIRAAAKDASVAEIFIYDYIGSYGVTAQDFAQALRALGDVKTITLRICSYGGEVFAGLAMYNLLKEHKASITVHIDGIAASMASVIAMAGDKVIMPDNAFLMIHAPSGGAWGKAEALKTQAELLDKIQVQMTAIYQGRSKLDDAKLAAMLATDTYLTAKEAKEAGFVDEISEAVEAVARFDTAKAALPANVKAVFATKPPPANTGQPPATTVPPPLGPSAEPDLATNPAAYGRRVGELCRIANMPEMAAHFLIKGASIAVVSDSLLRMQADDKAAGELSTQFLRDAQGKTQAPPTSGGINHAKIYATMNRRP